MVVAGHARGVLHYEMRAWEVFREPDTHVPAAPADIEDSGRGVLPPRESIQNELIIDLERQRLHRALPPPRPLLITRQLIIQPQRRIIRQRKPGLVRVLRLPVFRQGVGGARAGREPHFADVADEVGDLGVGGEQARDGGVCYVVWGRLGEDVERHGVAGDAAQVRGVEAARCGEGVEGGCRVEGEGGGEFVAVDGLEGEDFVGLFLFIFSWLAGSLFLGLFGWLEQRTRLLGFLRRCSGVSPSARGLNPAARASRSGSCRGRLGPLSRALRWRGERHRSRERDRAVRFS